MAGSATITGRQNYVLGIGHPKTEAPTEGAPAVFSENGKYLVGPDDLGAFLSPSPAGKLVSILEDAKVDASMLVVGDSTGNESTEWVDLFCAWAATKWPAYTIRRHLWDNTSKTYATVSDFNVGTSAFIFNVWNCSVSGSKLSENFGSSFVSAFVGKSASLIAINHGYNYQNGIAYSALIGAFSSGVESLLREYPSAGVLMIAQSPFRDSDLQSPNIRAVREYASMRGFGVADVYNAYIEAGRPSAWYQSDGVHPSPEGGEVWVNQVKPFFKTNLSIASEGSTLERCAASNLLINGNFDAVTGSVPDSWTLTNCVTALETTIFERGPRAIKVTANGATPRIQQDVIATNPNLIKQIEGGWVTLAVRVYVPVGGANSCGIVALRTDDGEIQCAPLGANTVSGGFYWRVVSAYIKRSPTLFRAYLYADTATGTTQYSIFDRAIIVKGLLPVDL